jgi:hypothetical protein
VLIEFVIQFEMHGMNNMKSDIRTLLLIYVSTIQTV